MLQNHQKKRRSDHALDDQIQSKVSKKHSSLVADHYNSRGNTSCAERRNSKIYYMRNFNNWIKSVLIRKYLDKVHQEINCKHPIVLDLGVGKGGDLLKWDKGQIQKLVCTDIASTSIDQCKDRYQGLRRKAKNRRVFDAEFIVSDLGKDVLYEKFSNPHMKHHISSCQFVIHYAFETEDRADTIVRNACSTLVNGGYFIGTTVNEVKLRRAQHCSDMKFGNDVYSVQFQSSPPFAEFGCKYIFKLHDVVDCPEFLLQKKSLIRLCRKYGMKLVEWKPFSQFFLENSSDRENFRLIRKMQALEEYPAASGQLNSSNPGDYSHADAECQRIQDQYPGSNPRVATLSKTEWEAASLYVVYVFVKDEKQSRNVEPNDDVSDDVDEKIPLAIL